MQWIIVLEFVKSCGDLCPYWRGLLWVSFHLFQEVAEMFCGWRWQINTCNGFYCDSFSPNKPYKPTIWTEAWSGWYVYSAYLLGKLPGLLSYYKWKYNRLTFLSTKLWRFTEFGGPIHQRPVQDLAYAVARFIQKGGSFVNYYMVSVP